MPHKDYLHKPTVIKDLIILVLVNAVLFIIFTQIDLLEVIYHFSREHETFELDELIPLGVSLALSFLVFSWRRIRELGLMAKTLEELSLVDPLSGLPNRRAGQISLISWCELASKKGQDFIVFQVDLDDFKRVNDMYGQLVGDDVLKLVAQKLRNKLPAGALLCRWLDDNFIIVCRLESLPSPKEFAELIQQSISGQIMTATINLTCCIGYAIYQRGQLVEDILHDTEDALSTAKHLGKNIIRGH